ncbi:MAG: hypothetical protein AYL30_001530 [Candidatus Hecatellales archaeon B24]|nr:MAG: hypothetical protein AYL30_001530 [Candidatus Hecatellales archaeon B24]
MVLTDIDRAIIAKFYRLHAAGAKHTPVDNVPKGFPKHLRGEVKKAVKRLIKESWLIPHPTRHGLDVALNSKRLPEAKKIAEEI